MINRKALKMTYMDQLCDKAYDLGIMAKLTGEDYKNEETLSKAIERETNGI